MELLPIIALFIASLTALVLASDKFVEAAERIGLSKGISPFIIGVTIVAFGTSLPELAASIASIYSGTSEIVVANAVGSNITNILLVLGLTALVGKSIRLDFDVMDIDMPLLISSAFIMYFTLQDQVFTLFEALIYLAALACFLIYSIQDNRDDEAKTYKTDSKDFLILILGAVFIFLGAKYTIVAIKSLSESAGISPEIIALSAVALGTSLPEVIVSISAAKRGKHAIAVGNVLGSNIFNTYAVMGISRLLGDLIIPESTINFSIPFMVGVTVLFGLMCLSRKISKWEGIVLLLLYAIFIKSLFEKGMVN